MFKRLLELTALAFLAIGLMAWPSWAADSDSAADDEAAADDAAQSDLVEYVEVNVTSLPTTNSIATKLPTEIQLTPANVGSVGEKLIDEQNAFNLGDTLTNISSLSTQAGPAVNEFFSIRGFDSLSSSLLLIDGAAEPESSLYPMYNIVGVEVFKGPAGFLYGISPLAGAVNLVRKQPLAGDFAVLSVTGGSFSTYQAALDWNIATGDGSKAFRLNALWRDSEGYRDGRERRVGGINPAFTWQISERNTLNFNLEYVDSEVAPDSGLPLVFDSSFQLTVPNVPRTNSYQSPIDKSDQQIGRFQVTFESQLTDKVRLRNNAYYRSLDWKSDGTLLNGSIPLPTTSLALRTLTRLDDEQRFVGNQLEAIWDGASGSVTHELLAGLEVAQNTDQFSVTAQPPQGTNPFNPTDTSNLCNPAFPGMPCIDVFNPVETFNGVDLEFPVGSGDGKTTIIAPYISDQIGFTRQVQLLVGARWDNIDIEDDLSGQSRSDGEISPFAGLTIAPTNTLTIYANAGKSHAPASLRVQGGNLDPEESTQYEVGVKKQFLQGRIRTTFALYNIERKNIALTNETALLQNPGDQESRGAEVDLAYETRGRLRTFLAYGYNDSELTRFVVTDRFGGPPTDLSGNKPPYAPEHMGRLWISKTFSNGLGVAGGPRYVSSQFFNADNAFEVDSALVWDAAAFYDFQAWRFKLNFKNLTDNEYETGSFASTSVVPGNAFAVYATVDYRF